MITTGSKFFLGLAAYGVVAAFAYALASDNEFVGTVTLGALALSALFLGLVTTAFRDAEVATAAYPDGLPEDASTIGRGPVTSPSMWPLVAAFGVALLLVGMISERWVFGAGIVVVVASVVEWTVQAWADRASDDAAYNHALRNSLMNPIEFPVMGALVIGLVVFGFSRVMLSLNRNAAVVVFISVAALIVIVAALFSGLRRIGLNVIVGVLMAAGSLVLAAGVITAVHGSRGFEPHEGGTNSNTVADKASLAGQFILHGNTLEPSENVNVPRSVTASVTFTNQGGRPAKLVVVGPDVLDSNGKPTGKKTTFETALAGDGQTRFLTVRITTPGVYPMHVDAADGSTIVDGTVTVL